MGLFFSRDKKDKHQNVDKYFLANKSLPWWTIGTSIIAANISGVQFIGMTGSGFASGLAIASYEWMSAVTIIIVAKFFIPIYSRLNIYTIPEFIEQRFGSRLKTILAGFWIVLYAFGLASSIYLGALALATLTDFSMFWIIIGLGIFSAGYSFYGGLNAIAWTDTIQVLVLVLGGLVTTVFALDLLSAGDGWVAGFTQLMKETPDRFQMILDKSNPEYIHLPGIWVLIGGMWVANLFYWGFNQYTIQRGLAAKSVKEAQRGMLLAAFLKLFMPIIVVLPGMAVYALVNRPDFIDGLEPILLNQLPEPGASDKAYPWLLSLLPSGMKGIAVAALIAAIVSSIASMLNSISTIFTMDIYAEIIHKKAEDKAIVKVGRITSMVVLIISCIMAPLLGGIDQAFQFIQEYSGIFSPGLLAILMLGLFWKKTTSKAAGIGVICSIPIAFGLKAIEGFPWMHQMSITTLATVMIVAVLSLYQKKPNARFLKIDWSNHPFKTDRVFNLIALIILLLCSVLYGLYW